MKPLVFVILFAAACPSGNTPACKSSTECESERGSESQCRDESLQAGGDNRKICVGD